MLGGDDAGAIRCRPVAQLSALWRSDRKHDQPLAEDDRRWRVGARDLRRQYVPDGDDIDRRPWNERAADRLASSTGSRTAATAARSHGLFRISPCSPCRFLRGADLIVFDGHLIRPERQTDRGRSRPGSSTN